MKRVSVIAALALFLAVSLWYGRPVDSIWNSPDETSNAFWAMRVAAGEPLKFVDEIVGLGKGAVHPRSMAVADDALVPGSFPGIILLYGVFFFLFKLPLFLYTPLLTALAGLCFGALVAKLFDRKVGALAVALFFVHPAVLYYGARGMFHNMLFIDALVLAAAFFALRPLSAYLGSRGRTDDAFGGFILAWALVVRTSEAAWVIPAFAAFLPFAGKDRWRRLGVAILGGLVPLLVFLRLNTTLYGSPLRTAYVAPAPVAAEVSIAAPTPDAKLVTTPKAFLPFGLHSRLVARNVWHYGLKLFWWQSLLAVAGFAWWLARSRKTTPQKTYAAAALLTSAWLAVLYGSWFIRDRLDPGTVTIGTSYVRYFLPVYIAALPFAALALVRLAELLRKPRTTSIVLILCAALGMYTAVFAGDESLHSVRMTLERNAEKKRTLLEWIEPEAVVMTERFDKLLVPERMRIIPATDAAAFEAAARATAYVPTYWYGLQPGEEEMARLLAAAEASQLILYEVGRPISGEVLLELDGFAEPEHDHGDEEGYVDE